MRSASNLHLIPKDIQSTGAYGDLKELAHYCGADYRHCKLNGEWQHGWIPPERNFHPEWVVGCSGESRLHRRRQTYFVARRDQSQFLNECGYTKVHAIGHPFIYTRKRIYQRIRNSLLIMPSHSTLEISTGQDESIDSYIQYITSIRDQFGDVYACVYSTDVEYYAHRFASIGIDIIEGSQENDQNSFQRMLGLGSQFEYMTTNYFGSHVAYLSYAGCKVSVAGPKPSISKSELQKLQFYQNAPFCLHTVDYVGELISKAYPSFLVDPWHAVLNVKWAEEQLGERNKLDPKDCLGIRSPATTSTSSQFSGVISGFEADRILISIVSKAGKKLWRKSLASLKKIKRLFNPIQCRSLTVQTHLTQDELVCLTSLSKTLPLHAAGAEIGSYFGASALATCAGFCSDTIKLYCIDTWMNNAMAYTDDEISNPELQEKDTFQVFLENTKICRDSILPLRGWSYEVFVELKKNKSTLDWLFIDGDHCYEGVKRDWDLYGSILNPNAIVIFHDTGWAEGVNQVIIDSVMDFCTLEYSLPNMKIFRYVGVPHWLDVDCNKSQVQK
jgi:hypothetical protein